MNIIEMYYFNILLFAIFIGLCGSVQISREGENLTSIPTDIDNSVTDLNLKGNLIAQVDTFRSLHLLKTLRLPYNLLSEFPYLNDSKLTLINLFLKGNQISIISEERLAGFPVLTNLDLSMNRLTAFPEVSIHSLKYLTLSMNKIVGSCPAFRRISYKLKHILLGANKIDSCERDAFLGLSQLEELNLENNDLHSVPDLSHVTGTLRFLSLTMNQITMVTTDYLRRLVAIETLRFHFLSLSRLPNLFALPATITTLAIPPMRCDDPMLKVVNWMRLHSLVTVRIVPTGSDVMRDCFTNEADRSRFLPDGLAVDFRSLRDSGGTGTVQSWKTSPMKLDNVNLTAVPGKGRHTYVRTELECYRLCRRDPSCLFFGLLKTARESGGVTCQLSDGDLIVYGVSGRWFSQYETYI